MPAAILCIWLGAEAWAALMAAAVALLAWEWVRLCGFSTRRLPGLAVPVLVLGAGTLAVEAAWAWAMALLVAGFAVLWAFGRPAGEPRARSGAWLAFGVLYIGLAGIALIHLRGDTAAGRGNVLFLFLVVWASDIGAYLAGRRFGGPKLAPAISPNKTWSGAAGGLAAAMLVGLLAAAVIAPERVGHRPGSAGRRGARGAGAARRPVRELAEAALQRQGQLRPDPRPWRAARSTGCGAGGGTGGGPVRRAAGRRDRTVALTPRRTRHAPEILHEGGVWL